MIIQKLVLENFISHAHTEIEFTQGVNIIVGHNGAGKSSIIDGIKLALFGESRGKYIQDMVKKGKRESSVYLEFSFGGNNYSVYRTITLGKSSQKGDAVLNRDGVLLAQTIKGVTVALGEILGIRKEIALNSVFVEQGQMDSLISSERAVRERTFSSILDLDTLSECAAALRDIARDYEIRMQGISFTPEDMENATERIKGVVEEIHTMEREKETAAERLNKISEEQRSEEEKLSKLRVTESRMQSLRQNIETARKQSKSMEKEVEEIKSIIGSIESNISKIEDSGYLKVLEIREQIEEFLRKSEKESIIMRNLSETEKSIEKLRKNAEIAERLKDSATKYRSVSDESSKLESELTLLRDKYYENSSARARVAKLRNELKAKYSRIKELEAALRKSLGIGGNEGIDIPTVSRVIENEAKTVRDQIANRKALKERISTMDEALEEQISKLRGKSTCPLCEQPLTDDHILRLNEEAGIKRRDLQQQRVKAEKELQDLENKEAICNSRSRYLNSGEVQEYLSLIRETANQEREIKELHLRIDDTTADSEKYVSMSEQLKSVKSSLGELQGDYLEYERARGIISEINEKELMERAGSMREEIKAIEAEKARLSNIVLFRSPEELRSILSSAIQSSHSLELEKGRLNSARRDLEYRMKIKVESDSSVERMEAELEPFKDIPELVLKQEKICEDLRNNFAGMTTELATINANIKASEERKNELESLAKEIQDSLARREKLRKSITVLKRMRECFDRDGIQKLIRQSATEFISDKMREYISMFGLRFDDLTVHDDMDVEVQQDGVVQPLSMLSGGERTAVSIGLRLALARYLSENINTIIMDEPTNYLDEERRSSLKDIIQNAFMNERIVPQMIIVTHHSELTAASDSTFTVTKVDGSSQVSAVF